MIKFHVLIRDDLGRSVVDDRELEGFVFCGVRGVRSQAHSAGVSVEHCRICVDGTALGSLQAFVALSAQMNSHESVREAVAQSEAEGVTFLRKPRGDVREAHSDNSGKLDASIVRLSKRVADSYGSPDLLADLSNVLAELRKHVTFPPEAPT